jgi:hypothetical protein
VVSVDDRIAGGVRAGEVRPTGERGRVEVVVDLKASAQDGGWHPVSHKDNWRRRRGPVEPNRAHGTAQSAVKRLGVIGRCPQLIGTSPPRFPVVRSRTANSRSVMLVHEHPRPAMAPRPLPGLWARQPRPSRGAANTTGTLCVGSQSNFSGPMRTNAVPMPLLGNRVLTRTVWRAGALSAGGSDQPRDATRSTPSVTGRPGRATLHSAGCFEMTKTTAGAPNR